MKSGTRGSLAGSAVFRSMKLPASVEVQNWFDFGTNWGYNNKKGTVHRITERGQLALNAGYAYGKSLRAEGKSLPGNS
jgi:hypothetical protein